jgi:hypothetical protein
LGNKKNREKLRFSQSVDKVVPLDVDGFNGVSNASGQFVYRGFCRSFRPFLFILHVSWGCGALLINNAPHPQANTFRAVDPLLGHSYRGHVQSDFSRPQMFYVSKFIALSTDRENFVFQNVAAHCWNWVLT